MKGTFLFLGTGASNGVPVIGCECAVCKSPLSQNKRKRPSGLVRVDGKVLLIDAGPDLREQALKYRIHHVDGFLLTHTHFDHIAGIDDLRAYTQMLQRPMPCLLSQETLQELQKRYAYLFEEARPNRSLCAQFTMHPLPSDRGETVFEGVRILYTSYGQSGMKVNGFRFGDFAYISDIREYDASIFPFLQGVHTLVLSAVRKTPSLLHFSVDEAVEFAKKSGVKKTWLTHLSHELDHAEMNRLLPSSVQLGFDGQELEFVYG